MHNVAHQHNMYVGMKEKNCEKDILESHQTILMNCCLFNVTWEIMAERYRKCRKIIFIVNDFLGKGHPFLISPLVS